MRLTMRQVHRYEAARAELEGQEAAHGAMVAAWPHLTDAGRRGAVRAWLREDDGATAPPRPDIARGPALDAFIGARR